MKSLISKVMFVCLPSLKNIAKKVIKLLTSIDKTCIRQIIVTQK